MIKARLVPLCFTSPGDVDSAAVRLQKMTYTINFAAQPAALGRLLEGEVELPAEVFSMKVRWL